MTLESQLEQYAHNVFILAGAAAPLDLCRACVQAIAAPTPEQLLEQIALAVRVMQPA